MNEIIQGDCLEVMRTFPYKSFDLVLTDPPYGIGADKMTLGNGTKRIFRGETRWDVRPNRVVFDEIRRISKNQIIWGGNYFASDLPDSRCWLVWDKLTGENDYADCELAWTSANRVVKKFTHLWVGNNAKDKNEVGRHHPTQKPKELMRWCLSLFPDAQTILDPFAGSGTTAVAAKELGRDCTGIEISEKYCEIARKRLSQEMLF